MANSLSACKTCKRAFFVFLWISTVYMCMISPAYAGEPTLLQDGTSGSCTWKYERIHDYTLLTIAPTNGVEGTLGSFSWADSPYKGITTRIVVKANVHAGPSTDSMFEDFEQAQSIKLSGLDITGVTSMKKMFSGCRGLALLDVSQWDVSEVVDMRWMFFGCRTLFSLDLSTWSVSDKTQMTGMFAGTQSLEEIRLGRDFCISSDAEFEDAGLYAGTKWMQVNLGKGGTFENPKGQIFQTVRELNAFHCDRSKRETDVEGYRRVLCVASAQLADSLDRGAGDKADKTASQDYDTEVPKASTKNGSERPTYVFVSWRDFNDNFHVDRQFEVDSLFMQAGSGSLVLEPIFEFSPQQSLSMG